MPIRTGTRVHGQALYGEHEKDIENRSLVGHRLHLDLLPGVFAVARLGPHDPIPCWARDGFFHSITRTADELSIISQESAVPASVTAERDFRCLRVRGPLDFGETGVLHSLTEPLTQACISVLGLSTYDTDYVFIRQGNVQAAMRALSKAGHTIREWSAGE